MGNEGKLMRYHMKKNVVKEKRRKNKLNQKDDNISTQAKT